MDVQLLLDSPCHVCSAVLHHAKRLRVALMGHGGSPSKFHSSIVLRRLQRLQKSHRGRLALLQQSAQRPAQCRASAAAPTAEAAIAEKPESAESATQTAAR